MKMEASAGRAGIDVLWQSQPIVAEDPPKARRARAPLVLIVDDDEAVRDLLRICLKIEGYNVMTASDGLQALTLLRRRKPDLVVLDIYMPILDGWSVLEAIRTDESLKELPVIMLTIERSPASIIRSWKEGVDCFISKPFDPQDIIAIIRRILQTG
jgi:DNA-binding response OmpR family regulator